MCLIMLMLNRRIQLVREKLTALVVVETGNCMQIPSISASNVNIIKGVDLSVRCYFVSTLSSLKRQLVSASFPLFMSIL